MASGQVPKEQDVWSNPWPTQNAPMDPGYAPNPSHQSMPDIKGGLQVSGHYGYATPLVINLPPGPQIVDLKATQIGNSNESAPLLETKYIDSGSMFNVNASLRQQPSKGDIDLVTNYTVDQAAIVSQDLITSTSVPQCPMLWFQGRKGTQALPVIKIDCQLFFHVCTGVGKLLCIFQNNTADTIDTLFLFPTEGTVTSCKVRVGGTVVTEDRYMQTAHVKPVEQLNTLALPPSTTLPDTGNLGEYEPGLFRCPITHVNAGDLVYINVEFLTPLTYTADGYLFEMPFTFPQGVLQPGRPLSEVLSVSGSVTEVVPDMAVSSRKHELTIVKSPGTTGFKVNFDSPILFEMDRKQGQLQGERDLSIIYTTAGDSILGTCLVAPNPALPTSNDFSVFVSPPHSSRLPGRFPRHVVFCIDISGSMSGGSWAKAKAAIVQGLRSLSSQDHFKMIYFNHKIVKETEFRPAIEAHGAIREMNSLEPHGGTNIFDAIKLCVQKLNETKQSLQNPVNFPLVFFITDGMVHEEREICLWAKENIGDIRFFALGIGKYCNWHFVTMLAQFGRGFSRFAAKSSQIKTKVTELIEMAQTPVLTDIEIGLGGVTGVQLHPDPIPDLYVNAPLNFAGTFAGQPYTLRQVVLRGRMANGEVFIMPIQVVLSPHIPVRKIMLKQQIESLSALAWLYEGSDTKQDYKSQVEYLSFTESVPSPYTKMILYETTNEQNMQDEAEGKSEKEVMQKRLASSNYNSSSTMMVAGSAILIAGTAFFAGDIVNSLLNSNGLSPGTDWFPDFSLGSDTGNSNCADCCEEFCCRRRYRGGSSGDDLNCNCSCPDCGGCGDICRCNCCCDLWNNCIEGGCDIWQGCCDNCACVEGLINSVGNICSDLPCCKMMDCINGDCICGACDKAGDCCGNIADAGGDCLGTSCTDVCGSLADCCAGLGDKIGDCSLCDVFGGLCENVGDLCGCIGDCLGSCDCAGGCDLACNC